MGKVSINRGETRTHILRASFFTFFGLSSILFHFFIPFETAVSPFKVWCEQFVVRWSKTTGSTTICSVVGIEFDTTNSKEIAILLKAFVRIALRLDNRSTQIESLNIRGK